MIQLLLVLAGFIATIAGADEHRGFYFPVEGQSRALVPFHPWSGKLPKRLDHRLPAMTPELQAAMISDLVGSGVKASELRPADDLPEVRRSLKRVLRKMPRSVVRLVQDSRYGVYLVHNLGATGYSTEFYDSETAEVPVGGIVVLDADRLRHPGNEWFSWKESRSFKSNDRYSIRVTIAEPRLDNRESGLSYVTLHEIAHMLSVGRRFHPHWETWRWTDSMTEKDYPFFATSWTLSKKKVSSRFDEVFPERAHLHFFDQPELSIEQAPALYEHLEATNYPTLFSAFEPFDDFADSFASYVHKVVMKKPYYVDVLKDGQVVKHFASCWSTPRCEDKAKILREFLGD